MPSTKMKRYVNLRSNALVEVLAEGSGTFRIATVTDDGYGRRRTAPADSFHDNFLAGDGQPHTSGYVPVNSLPGDHPRAMKTEVDWMELLDNLGSLSNAELADVISEQQRILNEAKTVIERAKEVVKSRRKEIGTELHGNTALVFTSGKKFDAGYALAALPPDVLQTVCAPKPSPTLARAVLGEKSPLYQACLKDHGFTLTVREATDKDRLEVLTQRGAAAAPVAADEVFELEHLSAPSS